LVHDAARCLITEFEINRLIDACIDDEVGGLLALPLPDTLKAASEMAASSATLPAKTSGWPKRRKCSELARCMPATSQGRKA
jgi:2-C-methyl-D-erythritol 4-phosphate cytidylyltransferase